VGLPVGNPICFSRHGMPIKSAERPQIFFRESSGFTLFSILVWVGGKFANAAVGAFNPLFGDGIHPEV